MSSENDELLPEFIAESVDMIEKAHHDIAVLVSGGDRGEALNSIFRTVHTIKGGASIFKFENTKVIAHKLESLLDTLRNAPESLTDADVTRIAKVIDHLELLLQNNDRLPAGAEAKVPPPAPPAPAPVDEIASEPQEDFAGMAAELTAVAAMAPEPNAPAADVAEAPQATVSATDEAPAAETAVAPEPTPVAEAQAAPKPAFAAEVSASDAPVARQVRAVTNVPSTPAHTEMLRVPVERVQRNLDVISEVFLIRNQMTYLVEKHFGNSGEGHGFVQAWETLDNSLRRSIGELEHVAMSMRMMPLSGLFARMDKTVRAYVSESGKQIKVEKGGEDTELDKKVLDALGEPLIHLIRNAMDHGIEDPGTRRRAGKPETGQITMSAAIAGNEVVITIGDDGKGIVAEKVKAAAVAKGLDVSRVTDDKSAIELIFVPGFSTAASVTETSGRGVGMDVVKSAVERLGGSISVDTQPGKGSSFVIRLPLSMSVIPAIIVRLNEQLYAVGTGDIIETQRIPVRELRTNAGEVFLKYRGEFIACHNLESFLQARGQTEREYRSSVFVCIVRHRDKYVALQVGSLENNTEIVVKPVPAVAPPISYVTGISVLPTGQPVFVLSLGRLCREKLVSGGNVSEAA